MRLSDKIWEEFGGLRTAVDFVEHDTRTVRFKESATQAEKDAIAALNGRLTLWQEGKIAADAKLPVRRMDNAIELLDRAQHADLADALRLHGEAVYVASWVEKDKL